MTFELAKLELHIEDDVLDQGEQLLASEKLRQVTQPEPGLWVAMVATNGESLEVEVLIKGSKVKAYTCECSPGKHAPPCAHVTALLLNRLQQPDPIPSPAPGKEAKSTPKRVTINNLLDLIPPRDLKRFIKKYASDHRQFALLFKAHFAHLLPRTAEHEPIAQLLANTLKTVKRTGKPLSRSNWKVIHSVLQVLLQQAEDALYKKHFTDVVETAEAMLDQLTPLLLMAEDRNQLKAYVTASINLLNELVNQSISPELEDQLWHLCLKEARKPVYYFYGLWPALLDLTLRLTNTGERSGELLDLIERKLKDSFVQKNERISAGLVNYKIKLFELQDNEAALHRYLAENIRHPEVLKQAILLARQQADWPQLRQLANYALASQQPTEGELVFLQDQLLNAAIHLQDQSQAQALAQALFLQTYQLDYFKLIKEQAGEQWPMQRTKLLALLEAQPFSLQKRKALANIYAQENLIDQLRILLKEAQSIDLLVAYDAFLFPQDNVDTQQMYFQIISHYLDNYLGLPAAVKVRECVRHLKEAGQRELAASLIKRIRQQYSERTALVKELTEL